MRKHKANLDEATKKVYFGLSEEDSAKIHRLFSPLKVPKVLNAAEIKVCLFLHNNVYPGGNVENEKLDVLEEAIQLSPCATKSLKDHFREVLQAKKWAVEEMRKAQAALPAMKK